MQSLSSSRAELNKLLAPLQVGEGICFALRGECTFRSPEINQRLHGLDVLWPQKIERGCGQDEVTEATVQLLLEVEMIEGLQEMVPVEVGVHTKHLQEDSPADADEVLGKATALADPFLASGLGALLRHGGVGDTRVVAWEDAGVINLARNPALHEGDVLVCWQLDGLVAAVEPSVGVVAASGHLRTGGAVADGGTVFAFFDNHTNKVPEHSIVFDNWVEVSLGL